MTLARSLRLALSASSALVALAFAPVALADVPPPNECSTSETVGSACTTAGPSFNQDGLCQNATCTSASPPPNGSTYACVLCELPDAAVPTGDAASPTSDASSGDAAVTGSDASTSTHDAATPPATKDAATGGDAAATSSGSSSSSGCAVAPAGAGLGGGGFFGLGAIGLALAVVARRRRI